MAFLLGSHQLVADLRLARKFGMIEGMKDWWNGIDNHYCPIKSRWMY